MDAMNDKRRYSRNTMLEGIGREGQQKLSQASVLVIGAGALGSIVSMYLAGSGVGTIGIADFDTIDISNLQRQLSFTEADLGKRKSEVTADKLMAINSNIKVNCIDKFITPSVIKSIAADYDIIVDGSDNPDTKYMITDTCVELDKICVFGGISQYAGQVLCYKPGAVSYRDIFPEAAPAGGFTPCAIGGVLGPLPGIVGSVMAAEVIKLITGVGKPLINRMLLIDALTMSFRTIEL
jgi:adenylyltransferase/sulfurtransferase